MCQNIYILSKTDATHFKISPLARIVQSSFNFFTTVSLLGQGTIPSISKNVPKNLTLSTKVFVNEVHLHMQHISKLI